MTDFSSKRTCRFCRERDDGLVQYALRSHAHPVCLFRRRGPAGINALNTAQILALPVMLLVRAGLPIERLRAMLNEHELADRKRALQGPSFERAVADYDAKRISADQAGERLGVPKTDFLIRYLKLHWQRNHPQTPGESNDD